MLDDLTTLVAFNTESSRAVTPLAAWLSERLSALGFDVRLIADPHQPGKHNVMACAGPVGTDGLVLTGHMDVVPTEGQPWSSDPFQLVERDGRLYGRGTADMKGFFAATLDALRELPIRSLRRELILLWTYDEEVGCLGSAHLAETLRAEDRPTPSACLVGEPTDFRILRLHPGHESWKLTVTGEAAHSSRPDLGVNAIEGMAMAVAQLRELTEELQREPVDLPGLDPNTVAVNAGVIRGGSAVNIVPDHCTLEFGFRPLPGQTRDDVANRLRQRLQTLAGRWTFALERQHGIAALHTQANTPLEQLLRPHSAPSESDAASFATDGGNLAALGMNPVVFGPGSIEVAHRADEFVEVRALHRASAILRQIIAARCLA